MAKSRFDEDDKVVESQPEKPKRELTPEEQVTRKHTSARLHVERDRVEERLNDVMHAIHLLESVPEISVYLEITKVNGPY